METIEFAYVLFRNGLKKSVPISNIPGFFPKNRKDFDNNRKMKVWWMGNKGKEDFMLNSNILLLGTSISDIHNQMKNSRIKYPNVRMASFQSFNGQQKSRQPEKKKQKSPKSKAEILLRNKASLSENKKILETHLKLKSSRRPLDVSSTEDSDSESNDEDPQSQMTPAQPGPSNLSRLTHRSETRDTVLIDDGMDNLLNDDIPTSRNNESLSDEGRQQVLNPENEENHTPDPSTSTQRSGDSVNRNLTAGSSNNGDSPLNRTFIRRNEVRRQLFPSENDQSGHQNRNRPPQNSAVQNNGSDDDTVHLGEGIYIDFDVWDTIKGKNDSIFVRELCEVIWGTEALKKRCLQPKRANKYVTEEESKRKELTPRKYKLLKDCLYNKITDAKVRGRLRKARMKKLWRYVSIKLYEAKNPK